MITPFWQFQTSPPPTPERLIYLNAFLLVENIWILEAKKLTYFIMVNSEFSNGCSYSGEGYSYLVLVQSGFFQQVLLIGSREYYWNMENTCQDNASKIIIKITKILYARNFSMIIKPG